MRLRAWLTVIAFGIAAAAQAAEAPAPHATVAIVEVDPANGAMLHSYDAVYVHVHYSSNVPVKIWVRPYANDKEVPAQSNASSVHPAGEGEALGWFACTETCEVHSIHVQLAAMDSGYPFLDYHSDDSYYFTWDGLPGPGHTPAAWVKPMQDEEKKRQEQAYKEQMNRPASAGDGLILVVFYVAILAALAACFVWPVWGVISWRDKWRWLAAAPLALVALKTLGIMLDFSRDRTSHNLLPFEYLMLAALVAPYMLIVWLLRRRAGRMAETDGTP
ncbi:MAG TPA: hypothetical protein VF651_03085 [Gammaproteobacteria bacterium]